jgi:phospholipid/cholesterol/gamma-HCH transport system ATP-binding protein
MPSELSGGMKKRVALARAICVLPEILLYDEPTTGLDSVNVRRISELILSLRAELGVTSVVVTHDLPSAFMVSDRLAMLAERRIVAVAPPAQFRDSQEPAVRELLGAMQTLPDQVQP